MNVALRFITACCLLVGDASGSLADEKAEDQKREVVATVVGEKITLEQLTPAEGSINRQGLSEDDYRKQLLAFRANSLLSRISVLVLDDYAVREKLSPSDKELEAMFQDFSQKHLADKKLDPASKKKFAMRMFWLMGASRDWRTSKALYEKYGGRVAVSAFGACISIEGRNAVFQEYATSGKVTIHHAELAHAFWEIVKKDRVLDVTLQPNSVKGFFAVPPWEREFKMITQQQPERNARKSN